MNAQVQLTQSMTQNTGFHLSNILKLMSLNLGISVIIPSYNAETTIEECLKTIFSETKNFDAEIIVVDDNSNDKTCEIVEKFKLVQLIKLKKKPGSWTR